MKLPSQPVEHALRPALCESLGTVASNPVHWSLPIQNFLCVCAGFCKGDLAEIFVQPFLPPVLCSENSSCLGPPRFSDPFSSTREHSEVHEGMFSLCMILELTRSKMKQFIGLVPLLLQEYLENHYLIYFVWIF